jgi:hypothetical protein
MADEHFPAPYTFTFSRFDALVPLSVVGLPDARILLEGPLPAALAVGSVLVYAALIFVVWPRAWADARTERARGGKPAEPSWAFAHHAFLALYSLAACVSAAASSVLAGEERDLVAFTCAPVPPWLRLVSLTFTASKVLEWLDTAVHFARGGTLGAGQLSFLHCYHHATTFLLFLITPNIPGLDKSGMLLNGFVHALMYAHYAWRFSWKGARPLITFAQIAQLATVTALWAASPRICGPGSAAANYARDAPLEFSLPFALVPVFLMLFIVFFVETYCRAKPKAAKAE